MQFNNRITVIYSALNDFGEDVAREERPMRCCIIEHNKRLKKNDGGKTNRFDLRFFVANRVYEPYRDLFEKSLPLQFRYDGATYDPVVVTAIRDFSGRVKYYEISSKEV